MVYKWLTCTYTFTIHLGNISLWSMRDVTARFRSKYMGCPHSLMSQNIPRNFLYSWYRFSTFLKWGGPWPSKKSGGMLVTQGLQRRWGHLPLPSSAVNCGQGASAVYPLGIPTDLALCYAELHHVTTDFGTPAGHEHVHRLFGAGCSSTVHWSSNSNWGGLCVFINHSSFVANDAGKGAVDRTMICFTSVFCVLLFLVMFVL